MQYVWDFAILGKYTHLFWLGLGWTMAHPIGTVFLGTVLGLVVGMLRVQRWALIDWLLVAYIELFRCTPLQAAIGRQLASSSRSSVRSRIAASASIGSPKAKPCAYSHPS